MSQVNVTPMSYFANEVPIILGLPVQHFLLAYLRKHDEVYALMANLNEQRL